MCDLDPSTISSEYDLLVFENVLLKLYKNDKKITKLMEHIEYCLTVGHLILFSAQ